MVKDEMDLKEWAAYHLGLGFEHIVVYDNESVVPVEIALGAYIMKKKVSVLQVGGRSKQCSEVYVDALKRFSERTHWMAFLDADEFLVPHYWDSVREFLSVREKHSAIGVNWQIFGDNNHVERPDGFVIDNYTKRSPVEYSGNRHLKSIVSMRSVLWPKNPHCFHLRDGWTMVDPNGKLIPRDPRYGQAFLEPPQVEAIQINHYFTKSLQDFRLKKIRGGGAGVRRDDTSFIESRENCNQVVDHRIARFRSKMLCEMY